MKIEEINFKYIENVIFCSLSLLLIFIGYITNTICVINNGGRMPVLSEYHFSDSLHFSYNDKSTVSKWYLSDIFKVGAVTFSIGDFLVYFGVLLGIIFSIKAIYFKIKISQNHS